MLLEVLFARTHRLPRSTLFPYTTLFRSHPARLRRERDVDPAAQRILIRPVAPGGGRIDDDHVRRPFGIAIGERSEEHTSELQSLRHLVCRLLLEKKKHPASRACTACELP